MYGFRGTLTNGEIVRMKGYKTYSRMRVAVKKHLIKLNILMVRWYEYKVDKNRFRIVAKGGQ